MEQGYWLQYKSKTHKNWTTYAFYGRLKDAEAAKDNWKEVNSNYEYRVVQLQVHVVST